ncbi:MAG: MBOAT family O-acyltransferase [Eubacteriales bacterium]
MLFNSFEFLIFFPIVALLYFILPHKYRWVLLLAASYYFYMAWKPGYILLIIFSTVVDYFASIWMAKQTDKRKRKVFLLISLFTNLGLLFIFKYFNFFNGAFFALFSQLNIPYNVPQFNLLLPMGISFYTFQTLSYTIDVYRGKREPETHFGIFALYVSFFPQLVAGPIERSDRLLPQFYQKHTFDFENMSDGLKRMAWGFFKKIVIADRLATLVDTVYANPGQFNGISFIAVALLFPIQLYCDFSGYSDIAIGSAKVMGFNLMENFKRPLFSKSVTEFWRRWHISLSSWFKDYLYIPLGGNRKGTFRTYLNLFITFVVSGLWHGADWGFVLWGALQGLVIGLERATQNIRARISEWLKLDRAPFLLKLFQVSYTTLMFAFGFILFRSRTVTKAHYILKGIVSITPDMLTVSALKTAMGSMGLGRVEFVFAMISVFVLWVVEMTERKVPLFSHDSKTPTVLKWALGLALVFSIILFGVFDNAIKFVYFQF